MSRTSTSAWREWVRTLLWVTLALAVLVGYRQWSGGVRLRPIGDAPSVGALVLRDLTGLPLRLSDLNGRVVVLNLWADWCPPCRIEVPRLSRISRDLGPEGLVVLGLNLESLSDAELGRAGAALGIDYRIVRAEAGLGGTLRDEGVLPHTWLIDRAGRLRASHAGLPSEGSLRRACRRLLRESPS